MSGVKNKEQLIKVDKQVFWWRRKVTCFDLEGVIVVQ
jgi:hypothetical protein